MRSSTSSRRARPAFLYTIPTFQNPSGRTLSTERRRRLVELAAEHDLLVLEDDPYGLVRYEGEPLPTLFELEGGERVITRSSFSKTVAPGLRVGWFVAPGAARRELEARAVLDVHLAAAPGAGDGLRVRRAAAASSRTSSACAACCGARRDAMLAALERELAGSAAWSRPEGGYFLWLDLPGRRRGRAARARRGRRASPSSRAPTSSRGERRRARAARVQLRLADEIAEAWRARRARVCGGVSCESSTPPTSPAGRAGSPRSASTRREDEVPRGSLSAA